MLFLEGWTGCKVLDTHQNHESYMSRTQQTAQDKHRSVRAGIAAQDDSKHRMTSRQTANSKARGSLATEQFCQRAGDGDAAEATLQFAGAG